MAETGSKEYIVLENMEQIKECLKQGMTMRAIAKSLNISPQTLYKYLKSNGFTLDEIKKTRSENVLELENTMFRSAIGYTVKVKKYAKLKRCIYENGKKSDEWEEMQEYEEEVYYPPDTTAGIFLLKNWGKYMNEPEALEIRRQELELRKKELEAKVW